MFRATDNGGHAFVLGMREEMGIHWHVNTRSCTDEKMTILARIEELRSQGAQKLLIWRRLPDGLAQELSEHYNGSEYTEIESILTNDLIRSVRGSINEATDNAFGLQDFLTMEATETQILGNGVEEDIVDERTEAPSVVTEVPEWKLAFFWKRDPGNDGDGLDAYEVRMEFWNADADVETDDGWAHLDCDLTEERAILQAVKDALGDRIRIEQDSDPTIVFSSIFQEELRELVKERDEDQFGQDEYDEENDDEEEPWKRSLHDDD